MEIENLFWIIAPFIGISISMYIWYNNRYKKEYIEENNEPQSKLKQKWLNSYIYLIWFKRARLRDANAIPYFFVVGVALLMLLTKYIILINPPLLTKDMPQITGYVSNVYYRKGNKGRDTIKIQTDNKKVSIKTLGLSLGYGTELEKIQNTKTKVTIWYRMKWNLFFYKSLEEINLNGKFLENNDKYHNENMIRYNKNLSNILFWIIYLILGLIWVWYLNRKEFPIHRLRRIQRYKKNKQMKDK